jgi:hypothetical protein
MYVSLLLTASASAAAPVTPEQAVFTPTSINANTVKRRMNFKEMGAY